MIHTITGDFGWCFSLLCLWCWSPNQLEQSLTVGANALQILETKKYGHGRIWWTLIQVWFVIHIGYWKVFFLWDAKGRALNQLGMCIGCNDLTLYNYFHLGSNAIQKQNQVDKINEIQSYFCTAFKLNKDENKNPLSILPHQWGLMNGAKSKSLIVK